MLESILFLLKWILANLNGMYELQKNLNQFR